MTLAKPRLLIDNLIFPEGPRWHDGRLFMSDFYAHEVVAVDLEGNRETIVHVPQQPSGLGWTPDGDLLIVSMLDRRLLRLDQAGTLSEVADLRKYYSFACNDMVVDGRGRAYVGGQPHIASEPGKPLDRDAIAPVDLICVDASGGPASGSPRIVATDMMIPNGAVVTPDGSQLIVAESFGLRLTSFDIDEDGSLSNRSVWAELAGMPDGICLDAEGCVWVGIPEPIEESCFVRVAQGGEIKQRLPLERWRGIAPMLGGPDGTTLFMLEALGFDPTMPRGSGRVTVADVEIPGAGWP